MGLFDGFPFASREQQEKDRAAFEKRVFPLGLAQRDKAREVLQQLLAGKRTRDTDRLFAYITAKDSYTQQQDPANALAAAQDTLKKQKWLTDESRRTMLALVLLEADTQTLENYPTADDVRRKAQALAEEQ